MLPSHDKDSHRVALVLEVPHHVDSGLAVDGVMLLTKVSVPEKAGFIQRGDLGFEQAKTLSDAVFLLGNTLVEGVLSAHVIFQSLSGSKEVNRRRAFFFKHRGTSVFFFLRKEASVFGVREDTGVVFFSLAHPGGIVVIDRGACVYLSQGACL